MALRTLVTAPPAAPAPYGLVKQAHPIKDKEWEHGITFTPILCYGVHGDLAPCPPLDKSAYQECQAPVVFAPYLLELGIVWNAIDTFKVEDLTTEALDTSSSSILEGLIAEGVAGGTNPIFDTAPVTVSGADAYDVLGQIEAELLDPTDHVGAAGVIHMSPQVANQIWGALSEEGGSLHTKAAHSLVVVGNYPADTIYGHVGGIDVYLGPILFQEAGDTHKYNEIAVRAERLATVAWTPCASVKGTIS